MARIKRFKHARPPVWIARSTDSLDRLSRLAPELLDRIFRYVYAKDLPLSPSDVLRSRSFPPPPTTSVAVISKALLPFHRRHYLHLRIVDPGRGHHLAELLSQCEHLKQLKLRNVLDLPFLLTLLPHPERLRFLQIAWDARVGDEGGVTSDFGPPLSRFSSLHRLALDCRVDLRHRGMRAALRATGLQRLDLGPRSAGPVGAEDILTLFEGREAVPSVKHLELDVVHGECGEDDLDEYHPANVLDSWTLPEWPRGFSKRAVEAIVRVGKRCGVAVEGLAVDAVEVENEYEQLLMRIEEKDEEAERWRRHSSGDGGASQEEEEDEEDANDW